MGCAKVLQTERITKFTRVFPRFRGQRVRPNAVSQSVATYICIPENAKNEPFSFAVYEVIVIFAIDQRKNDEKTILSYRSFPNERIMPRAEVGTTGTDA